MATQRFYVGDEFVSNGGRGPLRARLVEIVKRERSTTLAKLERWDGRRRTKRRVVFWLPFSFLRSPNCGWRLVK